MQVAIFLICIILMDQYCFVSLLDQFLVKTRDMAFGAHKNCGRMRRRQRFQNIQLFSSMTLAGSFRVYLFNPTF